MTDVEVAQVFDVIWHGGELLPAYNSATTLSEACTERVQHARNPCIARRPRNHAGGKLRKYDTAMREAMQALRADGYTLVAIGARLGVPVRTVHNIVRQT